MSRLLCLSALCWLALTLEPLWAVASQSNDAQHQAASMAVFTNGSVLEIRLELAAAEIESLKKENRTFVRATVREGGRSYSKVGIHLKGVGSFRPIDDKPSFTVKFNH